MLLRIDAALTTGEFFIPLSGVLSVASLVAQAKRLGFVAVASVNDARDLAAVHVAGTHRIGNIC